MSFSASAVTGSGVRATKEQLRALEAFGACDVSDAMVKLKYEHGGYIPDLDILSPGGYEKKLKTKIVGEAFTVKFVEGSNTDAPKAPQQYVDAAEEGSIMVLSTPANCKNAVWGGLMTTRAQYKQVKGVIIDGRCRDLSEHHEAGFPIFARGHSTLGSSPFVRCSTLQEPITINPTVTNTSEASFPPMTVNPYDVILADLDGVVVIPPKDLDEVLRLCKKGVEVDGRCMEDIKTGKGIAEAFKEHRGK